MKFYEHPAYIGCADEELDKKRADKFEKQYNERGFDDSCTWNLDYSIMEFIRPRFNRYYELMSEYIELEEEDRKDFELMREGFNVDYELVLPEEDQIKVTKAFELLAKHYYRLWW